MVVSRVDIEGKLMRVSYLVTADSNENVIIWRCG